MTNNYDDVSWHTDRVLQQQLTTRHDETRENSSRGARFLFILSFCFSGSRDRDEHNKKREMKGNKYKKSEKDKECK